MRIILLVVSFLILASIFGIQESFAENRTWYVGEGLKVGDYFEYALCKIDLNDCAPITWKMWIAGEKSHVGETLWDAKVIVIDDNKIIKGSMGLGKVAPEPVLFDDDFFDYAFAFKSSLVWLSAFATGNENDLIHGTKDLLDPRSGKTRAIGHAPQLVFIGTEIITTPAGKFDTVIWGWDYNNRQSKMWIVDDFPFPVKAKVFEIFTEEKIIDFEFELLDYRENILTNPFQDPFFDQELTPEMQKEMMKNLSPEFKTPKQQTDVSILPREVECKENLELIFKLTTGSPACIKSETSLILFKRGWGSENPHQIPILNHSIYYMEGGDQGPFKIKYVLVGSPLNEIKKDFDARSLIISLQANQDGQIIIDLPKNLLESWFEDPEPKFFVLVDGEEVNFMFENTSFSQKLKIDFPKGTKEIEIISASLWW